MRRAFARAGGRVLVVLEVTVAPVDRLLTWLSGGLAGRGGLTAVRLLGRKYTVLGGARCARLPGRGAVRRAFTRAGGRVLVVLEVTVAPVDRFLTWLSGGLDGWVARGGRVVRFAARGARSGWGRSLGWGGRVRGRLRGRLPRLPGLARLAALPLAFRVLGTVVALALIVVPYEVLWAKNAVAVTAGGRVVAQASGAQAVWAAVRRIEGDQEARFGLPVQVLGSIRVIPVHSNGPVLGGEALRLRLARFLTFGVEAAGISVDGRVRVVVRDAATARRTLADLTARYRAAGAAVRFANAVAVVPVTVAPGQVVGEDEAKSVLQAQVVRPATYTVREGDTLWQLARTFHTTVDRLVAENPGLDENQLAVGEVLQLTQPERVIDVVATFHKTYDEVLPYPVQWRSDDRLAWGEERVLQAGRDGEEQVVALVTDMDGVETGRRVVAKHVVRPPVPEIEAAGGGLMVASRGGEYHGGRLGWPARGPITSPFGWRYIFGRREFHQGIDIGAGYGSPVVAAAAGVVSFSGWEEGYGRVVKVDNGGGMMTLYAHLSNSFVQTGERVQQGQEVGRVGETGDATGPHVHFGVYVDGAPVNPLEFL